MLLAQIVYIALRPDFSEQLLTFLPSAVLVLITALSILDGRRSRKASEKMADALRLSNILDHELSKVDLQVAEGGVGAWGILKGSSGEVVLVEEVVRTDQSRLNEISDIGCGFVLLLKNFEERSVRIELGAENSFEKIAVLDIAQIGGYEEGERTRQAELLYNLAARQELAKLVRGADLSPYLAGDTKATSAVPILLPPRSYVYLHVVIVKSFEFWQKHYGRIIDAYASGGAGTKTRITKVSEDKALTFFCNLKIYSLLNPNRVVREESISFLALPKLPGELLEVITNRTRSAIADKNLEEVFQGVACHPTHTVSFMV